MYCVLVWHRTYIWSEGLRIAARPAMWQRERRTAWLGKSPRAQTNMKNATIKDVIQAFGPGAHLFADAAWRREANGCAYADIRVCVSVIDGTGRVVARAVDAYTENILFVSYDEEDTWWHGHHGVRGSGKGGRAAAARCRELEQEDWGGTPANWFDSLDGSLLPWEDELSDGYVGGTVPLSKGHRW